jgi:uncharacterized protein
MTDPSDPIERVAGTLASIGTLAVAVSGGVDSMTLAHVAHRTLGPDAVMYHAVSAAVPGDATLRVRRHAERAGWHLEELDAGEMRDERYLANPVDRCFWCKTDLYGRIARATDAVIVSGTNTDDLGDYRPGLRAADDHGVRHPYVDAAVDKSGVRAIARGLGLADLSELPAAPCLSSRIETGIRVTPHRLSTVERVEQLLRDRVGDRYDVRCRIRASGVVIELDRALVANAATHHGPAVRSLLAELESEDEVTFEPYRKGSAFLRVIET